MGLTELEKDGLLHGSTGWTGKCAVRAFVYGLSLQGQSAVLL